MGLPDYSKETQILKAVLWNPRRRFRWLPHALKAVADEGMTTQDVEDSLMNGQVVLVEWKKDILWRTVGRTLDGERVEAVIAVYEEAVVIKFITVFT